MSTLSQIILASSTVALYLGTTYFLKTSKQQQPLEKKEKTVKPTIVFVLGGPGSGKGTQCANIQNEFGFKHLSAGDLLRAERNNPASEHGALINEYIREGKIVPSEITVQLLKNAMSDSDVDYFLIDGFPRNAENNGSFESIIGRDAHLACLLNFECPEEVMLQRLLGRGQGRIDDNEESIRKRFATFNEETQYVIEYYRQKGKVLDVDTSRDVESVYHDVKLIFESLLAMSN